MWWWVRVKILPLDSTFEQRKLTISKNKTNLQSTSSMDMYVSIHTLLRMQMCFSKNYGTILEVTSYRLCRAESKYGFLLQFTICWCKHNNNGNHTKRNWIILLNIINLKRKITQHYLDWGVTLALFKEIQVLG